MLNTPAGKTSILAGAAAVLALVGVTLLIAPPAEPDRRSRPDTATAPVTSPSPSTDSDTATDPSTDTPPTGGGSAKPDIVMTPEQKRQQRVVTAFAKAFTATGPQQQWLNRLRPNVSAELLEGLRYTDPRQRATGTLVSVTATPQPGQFVVDYRGGQPLNVTVTPRGDSWQVETVTPVPPPPAPSGTDL